MAKKLEIENLSRNHLIFEAWRKGVGDRMVHDHDNDLVLGDSANTEAVMAAHKAAYSRRVPAPVQLVDADWPTKLNPVTREWFDGLVRTKQLRVREVTV